MESGRGWRFALRSSTSAMEFFIVKQKKMRLDAIGRPLKGVRGRIGGKTTAPSPTHCLMETVEKMS